MLGVSFETSSDALIDQIPSALSVFAAAMEDYFKVQANQVRKLFSTTSNKIFPIVCAQKFWLSPRLSCMDGASSTLETRWSLGDTFYK